MINVRINDGPTRLTPRIMVVGVGGGGCNAVNNMIRSGLDGCEFLACNTDAQALQQSLADHQIQLGISVTSGLGAGARPDVGRAAAEESLDDIINYLDGANMVFIACGMGGGTGSGAAPVIARAARDHGILTVGVATKPFHFEGVNRMNIAEEGLKELQQYVDTLIVIPNQNLFRIANEKTTFSDAFTMADDVLQSGVRGVTDLMVMPGLINLDFADIKSVMAEMGKAMMGTGEASGEKRAIEASESAISNPLLDDVSMKGAKGVLINITGGLDMTLFEVDEAANRIRDEVDVDANIIFGSTFDETMEGTMRVSVVATGIDQVELQRTIPETSTVHPMARAQQKSSNVEGPFARQAASMRAEANSQRTDQSQQSIGKVTQNSNVNTRSTVLDNAQSDKEENFYQRQVAVGESAASQSVSTSEQQTVNQGIMTPYGHHIPPAGTPVTTPPQIKTSLQPSRVGDSFIPPQPATAQTSVQVDPSNAQSTDQADTGDKISDTSRQNPTLVEKRPVVEVKRNTEAEAKRSPTLFERLKEGISARHKEEEIHKVEPSVGEAQKTLGIDTGSSKESDDLDIPAFLRRQSS